jgi:hypothetical protein
MLPLRIVITLVAAIAPPAAPSSAQIDAMIREADAIWRPHGVQVALSRPADSRHGGVPLTLELAPSSGQRRRLGAVWLVDGVPQDRIVVVPHEVAAVLAAVPWKGRPLAYWPKAVIDGVKGRALGRVLAHELGHYLLASGAHTSAGLMQRAFSGADLGSTDRRAFQIDPTYMPRLNARLARLHPQPPVVASLEQP